MPAGLEITTKGLQLTSDLSVLYLISTMTINSKMSDQRLEFFTPNPTSATHRDWYYNRLNVGAYLQGFLDPPGKIANMTAVLRRFDITSMVSAGCKLFAISAIPGLASKSYVYTSGGRYYLRYSATTKDDLNLVIYGFGSELPNPRTNAGIVLSNSSGKITFDTSRYPLRLANVLNLNSSSNYAYICQYTYSSAQSQSGANYDFGYSPFTITETGSSPDYIDTDYTVKDNIYLCDSWSRSSTAFELWDTDEWYQLYSYTYGTKPPISFINVTGYLD